ncbi:MAG: glycosyltransferase family 2 protein [Prevotella sp.]|jgi:glycosyltransferase involved in cell wall biosynthesis|nr:glycosyltransferase family 2 protein [Prevotella sp.]
MAETLNSITNPKISIIVPCYNQDKYLPDTLQSVLNQDYANWECIIVNDGSPDNTEEVAGLWTAKDNRFRYFKKENGGLSDARNFGIKHASGEYILPLDSDDKIGPQYTSEAMDVFRNDPEVKVVYSNLVLFGTKNRKFRTPDFDYKKLFEENLIFCSGIYRKSDFLQTPGYNTNMTGGLEDWDFWLGFIKKDDKVVKLEKYHFYYRIKEVSMLSSLDKEQNERLLLQIFKNHLSLYLEYFNPVREHIEAKYFREKASLYRNSIEYKTGNFLCSPVKFMGKVFRRVFSQRKSD